MIDFGNCEENGMKIYFVRPAKVLDSGGAAGAENLMTGGIRQATLKTRKGCRLEKGGYVLLDFGRELHGGVDLTLGWVPQEARLHLTFGESVTEALSNIGEKNAGNDHSPRDFFVLAEAMSHFRAGNTGFRFVRLEAADGEIEIAGVQAFLEIRDLKPEGSFSCNDSRLNQIWDTGVYTVLLNMQEYLWDGIKRDRLVWIGDMHPEVSAVCSVFGFDPCVPRSLDLIRDETPEDAWMNGFPSYSMWWVMIHYDWYLQNGNLAYLQEQSGYLKTLLRRLASAVNPDGSWQFPGAMDFVDWSSYQTPFAPAGVEAVLSLALGKGAALCRILQDAELEAECLQAKARLGKRRLNFDGNKQMAALVSLAGFEPAKKVEDTVLGVNPCSGLSAFLGYYVLHARANGGNMPGALEVIRNYWGGMLDMGATTFWEDFDLDWAKEAQPIDQMPIPGKKDIHGDFGSFCFTGFRRSLCHGWASGPMPFLSRRVLGIRPVSPGCEKMVIRPELGDLEWARGSYPTPYGLVQVEHTVENGVVHTEYRAPKQVEILGEETETDEVM